MKTIRRIAVGNDRTRVAVALYEIGPDLLAIIEGEGAHIGAATLAESDDRVGFRSETVSALGHREFELTREFSQTMSAASGRRTVTIAGIHLDDIREGEIEAIRRNVAEAATVLSSTVAA
jgi:hypothetical protein